MDCEQELIAYINREIMEGHASDLDALTPLLELRIIDSVSSAMLVAHISATYGVKVPPEYLTAAHLQDVRSIAKLIEQLRVRQSPD